MKKRLNSTFFGICFLAALLGEAYCILVLNGELISTIGIGVVVLITGYLLLDSVISGMKNHIEQAKQYADRILQEEIQRSNERYTELVNFQKAIYTATKKNTAILTEQLKEIAAGIDTAGNSSLKELQRIIDLQKKSMEGQKNALNMEIHYNKENTKQLISALQGTENKTDYLQQIEDIIKLLEENKQLLSSGIVTLDVYKQTQNIEQDKEEQNSFDSFNFSEYDNKDIAYTEEEEVAEEPQDNNYTAAEDLTDPDYPEAVIEEPSVQEQSFLSQDLLDQVIMGDSGQFEDESEFDNKEGQPKDTQEDNTSPELPDEEEAGLDTMVNEEPAKTVTPLYSDPNKSLTPDEIAALFASFGQ